MAMRVNFVDVVSSNGLTFTYTPPLEITSGFGGVLKEMFHAGMSELWAKADPNGDYPNTLEINFNLPESMLFIETYVKNLTQSTAAEFNHWANLNFPNQNELLAFYEDVQYLEIDELSARVKDLIMVANPLALLQQGYGANVNKGNGPNVNQGNDANGKWGNGPSVNLSLNFMGHGNVHQNENPLNLAVPENKNYCIEDSEDDKEFDTSIPESSKSSDSSYSTGADNK